MIIVVSPTDILPNETNHLNAMFDNGLDLFHFRKYGLEDQLALNYISKVNDKYRKMIVLHSHHHLANKLEIERLHFNSETRHSNKHIELTDNYFISTSTHSIHEFNELNSRWSYAFLSPTYQSISKPGYGKSGTVLPEIKYRKNYQVDLIGLGGINYQNMETVLNNNVAGIALMGAVWNQSNPASYLLACKQKEIMWKEKINL